MSTTTESERASSTGSRDKGQEAAFLRHCLRAACECFKVDEESAMGPSRVRRIAKARYVYFWLARRKRRATLKATGALVGRCHSTVSHGLSQLCDLRDTEPDLRRALVWLETNFDLLEGR